MMLILQSPASQVGGRYVTRAPAMGSHRQSVGHQSSGHGYQTVGLPTTQQMEQYKAKALEFDRR